MTAVRNNVVAAYGTYRAWPLNPLGLVDPEAKDFDDAYAAPASAMKAQRAAIQLHYSQVAGGIECPYCLISEAATLDHALPRAAFPEFSVLSKNLVPSCDICNRGKGSRWRTAAGDRLYPHPYYDSPGAQPLIACTLTIGAGGVASVVFAAAPLGTAIAAMYSELFADTGLQHRLRRLGGSAWTRFASNTARLRKKRDLDVAAVRERLDDKLDEDTHNFGVHYWRRALWVAGLELSDGDLHLATES